MHTLNILKNGINNTSHFYIGYLDKNHTFSYKTIPYSMCLRYAPVALNPLQVPLLTLFIV